ncbi:MAG: hypothetical protein PHW10_04955 [Candidatus Peribacteraceae bacterium]|nr:hypothetical protein [Candidatus Peribacteraceae bacterium]
MSRRSTVIVVILVLVILAVGYLYQSGNLSLAGTSSDREGVCCATTEVDGAPRNICIRRIMSPAKCSQTVNGKWFVTADACNKFVTERPSDPLCSQ